MQHATSSRGNTRCTVQHAPCNVRTLSQTSLRPSSRSSRPLRSASSRMRKSQTLAPRGSCRGQYPMESQAARYPPRGSCRVLTVLHCTMRCGAVRCGGTQNCTIKYSHHTARYHASRPLIPSAAPQETCGAIVDRSAGAFTLPQQTNGIPCAHCCAAHGPHRIASHRIASHRIARSVATSTASVAKRLSAWQQQRVERSRARRCVATR